VDALTERIKLLEEERELSQKTVRDILNKIKHLNGELRR